MADETTAAEGCLASLLMLLLAPAVATFQLWSEAYVMHKLWAWHIVGLGGMPQVGLGVFVTASAAITMARYRHRVPREDKRPKHDQHAALAIGLALPWMLLLAAWWLK